MGLRQEITDRAKEIIDTTLTFEEVNTVPDITNPKLTFGNTGLRFEATVLYIDMRDSTKILEKHNKPVVAKIHKAYLHTTVKITTSLGGEVRSFNGDSVLAFFPGKTQSSISNAVKAAMQIRFMIAHEGSGINKLLKPYSAVDFGIGIDHGNILCTKIGVGWDNNTKDLVWIGSPINKSVIMSDQCRSPYHIGISNLVYINLTDSAKFGTQKNAWGQELSTNMWTLSQVLYNGSSESYYKSNWYWEVM
jgi:adenylate cyclase